MALIVGALMPVDAALRAVEDHALGQVHIAIMDRGANGRQESIFLVGPDIAAIVPNAAGEAMIAVPGCELAGVGIVNVHQALFVSIRGYRVV